MTSDQEVEQILENMAYGLDRLQFHNRQIEFDEPTKTTKVYANLTCDRLNGKPIDSYTTNDSLEGKAPLVHTHTMSEITDYNKSRWTIYWYSYSST